MNLSQQLNYLIIFKLFLNWEQEISSNQPIGIIVSVFANGPGDKGSIPHQIIPKIGTLYLLA